MDHKFNCWEMQAACLLAEKQYNLADVWPLFWQHPFNAAPARETVGASLRSVNFNMQSAIWDVLGVPVREYCFPDLDPTLDRIEQELALGRGVLAFANAIFCPWSPAYNLYGNSHFVLVRSVDRTRQALVVDDLFHAKRGQSLPVDLFNRGRGSLFSFEFDRAVGPQPISTRDRLALGLERSHARFGTGHSGIAARMTDLLRDGFCYDDEVRHFETNWWSSPLFSKLLKIEYAHHNIASVLRRDRLAEAEAFEALAKSWGTIRAFLLAGKNNATQGRAIRAVIDTIVKIEEKSRAIEERFLDGPPAKTPALLGQSVDIGDLFQTRWFETTHAPASGFASDLRLSRSDWSDVLQIEGDEIAFDGRAIEGTGNDCVICRGQELSLPADREARDVYVLYTRESTGLPDEFVLSTDRSSEHHPLSANTLFSVVEQPLERVAWAELQRSSGGETQPTQQMGYLFAKRFSLDYRARNLRLRLPDDAQTYLFAVTTR